MSVNAVPENASPLKPEEVMRSADQPTVDLHKRLADESTKAGYPVTPANVNPVNDSPLEEIRNAVGGTAQVLGSAIGEFAHGTDGKTYVHAGTNKRPVSIARFREMLMGRLKKAA